MYRADGREFDDSTFIYAGQKGIRADRSTAMEMACLIVHARSVRQKFIAPSEETLSWGGFLGGENSVWTDKDAEEAATVAIGDLVGGFLL
jgi:hypothetical protein